VPPALRAATIAGIGAAAGRSGEAMAVELRASSFLVLAVDTTMLGAGQMISVATLGLGAVTTFASAVAGSEYLALRMCRRERREADEQCCRRDCFHDSPKSFENKQTLLRRATRPVSGKGPSPTPMASAAATASAVVAYVELLRDGMPWQEPRPVAR
jgi:hypothetical protein